MNKSYKAFKMFFRIFFLIFALFPLIWGVRTSILANDADISIIPKEISFKTYIQYLSSDSIFWRALKNSGTVAVGTIMLLVPIVICGSYALGRIKFKGEQFGRIFLYLPLVPPIALTVQLSSQIQRVGLYNNLFAIILLNTAFLSPFTIWLLRNFMKSISPSLEEAATLDGCNRFKSLLYIIIPSAAPGIITVIVYTFIQSWLIFLYAYTVITTGELMVVPQVISGFISSYTTSYTLLCTFSVIALVPPLLFFLIFQRWFIAGLFGNMSK
jgi:multiple sugar transport system permease protein